MWKYYGVFLGICLFISGCSFWANKPLDTLYYPSAEGGRRENLFVFMRGLGGSHRSFASQGLVEDVRSRHLPFDMAAPNAHFAYYYSRTLMERLREDVIAPAQRKGYRHIWLVGFSMGGLGAVLYMREHPEDIDGVVLISPFLGYPSIIGEIKKAGGVRTWSPGPFDPDEDWQRMLWAWLKTKERHDESEGLIYLGFGEKDPYVDAHHLLSDVLPVEQVFQVDGAHDYKTFKTLWSLFLDKANF